MTTAVFLGNSVTLALGITTPYGQVCSTRLGWTYVGKGVGSTGYLNPPATGLDY